MTHVGLILSWSGPFPFDTRRVQNCRGWTEPNRHLSQMGDELKMAIYWHVPCPLRWSARLWSNTCDALPCRRGSPFGTRHASLINAHGGGPSSLAHGSLKREWYISNFHRDKIGRRRRVEEEEAAARRSWTSWWLLEEGIETLGRIEGSPHGDAIGGGRSPRSDSAGSCQLNRSSAVFSCAGCCNGDVRGLAREIPDFDLCLFPEGHPVGARSPPPRRRLPCNRWKRRCSFPGGTMCISLWYIPAPLQCWGRGMCLYSQTII